MKLKIFLFFISLISCCNITFSQESMYKDDIDLSIYFMESEEGDSLLMFKIINNSSDSINVFPPFSGTSAVVYLLPNQEELEYSVIDCSGVVVDGFEKLPPGKIKIYYHPFKLIHRVLNLHDHGSKFGYNATYQVYWKIHDGRYIEETIFGTEGRSRVDRKPTYLKSNLISIKL